MAPQRQNRSPLIAALAITGTSLALLFAVPGDDLPEPAANTQAQSQTPRLVSDGTRILRAMPLATERFAHGERPLSLRGSDVDGALLVDSTGHFLPSPSALALFDYFLAASGEQSEAQLRWRIIAEIESRLSPEAAFDATLLLDTYLDFRHALRDLAQSSAAPAELAQRWQSIGQLRREFFGEDGAEHLFGEAEQVISLDLERRRIHLDTTLSTADKSLQLHAISEALPPAIRTARQRANAPAHNYAAVATLRSQGGDDGEIFALRASDFGNAAAQRLATLDRQQEAWRQRLDNYRTARNQVIKQASAADLSALRAIHFSDENERRRVRALDQVTL